MSSFVPLSSHFRMLWGQGGEEVDILVQSPVLICKSFSEFFFYSIEMHKDLLSRLGVYMLINNSGVLI